MPHRRADSRGIRRVFSISSADADTGTVSFGIKIPAEGSSSFKRTFAELPPGSRIQATTVGGDFVLPADTAEPLLMVAGGIGITPFISHLAECTDPARAAGCRAGLRGGRSERDPLPRTCFPRPGSGWCWSPRAPRNLPDGWERGHRAVDPAKSWRPGAGHRATGTPTSPGRRRW